MSRRRRLGRIRWLSGWGSIVPLVAAGAGLMFATSAQTSQGTDLRSSGRVDLVDVVRARDREVRQRAAEVQQLQDQVDSLIAEGVPGNAELARLRAEAAALVPTVGTRAVTGPALVVSLDDSKHSIATLPEGYTANDLVVHQQDVQNVVNALWAGGAEAMMVHDQRVISTSAVKCVGNVLILKGRVYSPPYVIQAIGDQAGMRAALDGSKQVRDYRDYAHLFDLGYDVSNKAQAIFPAYAGSLSLLHAKTQ